MSMFCNKNLKERGCASVLRSHRTDGEGIGNGAIGKWRTLKPNLGNLEKVADCLGVSVVDIIKKSEEKKE